MRRWLQVLCNSRNTMCHSRSYSCSAVRFRAQALPLLPRLLLSSFHPAQCHWQASSKKLPRGKELPCSWTLTWAQGAGPSVRLKLPDTRRQLLQSWAILRVRLRKAAMALLPRFLLWRRRRCRVWLLAGRPMRMLPL